MVVGARMTGPPPAKGSWGAKNLSLSSRERIANNLKRVVCDPTVYRYESAQGEYPATITLVWNRDHVVDSAVLTLYKCDVLGAHRGQQDCSLCVTRAPKFRCAWCDSTCRFAAHCPSAAALQPVMHTDLLPQGMRGHSFNHCPTPRIDVIQPLAGPLEGGTLVTIEGSNLGLREEDVRGNVYIGEVPCSVQSYHVSVKIVCRTGPAPHRLRSRPTSQLMFPVRVATPAGSTESTVKFSYTNVSVTGVWPHLGPMSGGTVLSVSGHFLNVGSDVTATLDELPCIVNKTQSSSHRLVCITSSASSEGNRYSSRKIRLLTVTVDGARRFLPTPFVYTPDPKLLQLKPLRTPWSGGRMLTVHGTHFDSIQAPRVMVFLPHKVLNSSSCLVISASQIACPSPALDPEAVFSLLETTEDSARRRRSVAPDGVDSVRRSEVENSEVDLDLGFVMDGVREVRHPRKHFPGLSSQLTYVPNPIYHQFPTRVKLYKGDTLVIEGEGINLASDETDVAVTIGTSPCNVTSLTSTQLVCMPPVDQPSPTDERGVLVSERLPLVIVRVGSNIRFTLGLLRYEKNSRFRLSSQGIAGLAAGVLFLVLGGFAVLALYRRKTSQAERVYKLMQLQMDSLESHVRTECKQAFAELQTDMTDLTADLESSGIPTLDHRSYVMKVFFPGVTDHPILNEPKDLQGPRSNYDVAMLQFEQLLANRNFLLTFIETLESEKTFNIRDKVNVASLLTVLLLGRMEYLTEVLRLLLLRLITSASATKHPQLMLRRTESVVEKLLTNWLALCLYDYMKEDAGTSLFLLFKAIKHQVDKGPVDALTFDARYSISEEKLLREQVEANTVTIHLVQDEPHYEKIPYQASTYSGCPPSALSLAHHDHHHQRHQHSLRPPHLMTTGCQTLAMYSEEYEEKVQVKVLDCDTVSQVKSKILDALYKNTPYSLRPSVHEVDLEWRHGRAGRVCLSDEDRTTTTQVGGWRRLNTLAHYGVRDSTAVMALVPRQNDSFSSHGTGYYSYANSITPLSSPLDDMKERGRSKGQGGGYKVYHLVRPTEEPFLGNGLLDPSAGERTYGTHKAIPEIFLTRLLSTKHTIQQFVDDFVRTILSPNDSLPPPVKWLFDLLDEAARSHGITDPEVIHAWKSNAFPLRFWVTFIKNPDFIFDIAKTPAIDACLSVVAQTFIDACSTTEHRLGKDSPSNKLLFAKDLPRYRAQVASFYTDVASAQAVTDQELSQLMQQLSSSHMGQFDNLAALKELYIYVTKYHEQLVESLDVDTFCRKLNLSHRLQSIAYILESCTNAGPFSPMPPMQLSGQLSEL